jgi:hypothetical protein
MSKNKQNENYKKLLDVILDNPKYYPGSFHKDSNLTELIDCVDQVLFKQDNDSMNIIIEKNSNNSLDLTVDLIK